MKIYQHGKLIEVVKRPVMQDFAKTPKTTMPTRSRLSRNRRGSNQHETKRKSDYKKILFTYLAILVLIIAGVKVWNAYFYPPIISPLPKAHAQEKPAGESAKVKIVSPTPTIEATPTPTELEEIVAYIARKFEPEGKAVVVRAINCFYSESGLRSNAVGQNSDGPKSKDYGVAQLNDHWHKLTPAQKTDIKANIDKAYDIYKGRGDSFSAWYGKLCNN